MTTPTARGQTSDPKQADGFSVSKFYVPKIPDFDKSFSPKHGNESKLQQQSGQSSGDHDGIAPLAFSSVGRFSKF
jgi:hypothetical protein|tara:strand:+ start:354 stop:578 length:225 start_codon:yes stop_codon:yes gene_type:complete